MMPIHAKGIRAVAFFMVVVLAGYFCLSAWAPEADGEKGKTDNSTSVTSASGEEDTPGVQEQEAPAKVKKKHFPWFWVAAGVVVAGVILYFTVIKKPEYKLTVAVGTGVSGSPTAGIFAYKKGKRVSYSFTLKEGYKNLRVYLDGSAVAAAGEIDMYRHHYLVAAATEELYYDLTVTLGVGVTGTPAAGVATHKEMSSVAYNYTEASGYANLKVQVDGVDAPAQGTLLMDRSHALSASADEISDEIDLTGEWTIQRVSTQPYGTVLDKTLIVHAVFSKWPHHSASTDWTGLVQLTSTPGFHYGIGQAHYLVDGNTVWFFNGSSSGYSYFGNLNGNNQMVGTYRIMRGYSDVETEDFGTWTAARN